MQRLQVKQSRTALNKYMGGCERNQEMDFFTGRSTIKDYGLYFSRFEFKTSITMDLFLTKTQIWASRDVN